ncbi:phosphoribosylglycinamide formyltransferase [Hoylesella timonensis]|uniref:phosphoribosylglycinamide formyltransferase n=1 Tax=Hoylesella timonensis TaxID=386414 RepID=UPI00242D970F|nr:phosphoribosylglycinamide formyltransferase [Hoylesella timonensis]
MKSTSSLNALHARPRRVAIFVSGSGTNCENIIRYFAQSTTIQISLVLSNKSDAYALTRAKRLGVPTIIVPKKDFNDASILLPILQSNDIDFIALAGFLLMIPNFLIAAFPKRMINIHPALLPKFGGKGMYGHHVHEAVKAAGETETGFTVHWVSDVCDGGEIIAQYRTPLDSTDTVEDIAEKEHQLEMKYFPSVIEKVITEAF